MVLVQLLKSKFGSVVVGIVLVGVALLSIYCFIEYLKYTRLRPYNFEMSYMPII